MDPRTLQMQNTPSLILMEMPLCSDSPSWDCCMSFRADATDNKFVVRGHRNADTTNINTVLVVCFEMRKAKSRTGSNPSQGAPVTSTFGRLVASFLLFLTAAYDTGPLVQQSENFGPKKLFSSQNTPRVQ